MGVIRLCKGETLTFGKFTSSKQSTMYMYTLPSYILHYIVPLADTPHSSTLSLVRVVLPWRYFTINDIPSSLIGLTPTVNTLNEALPV